MQSQDVQVAPLKLDIVLRKCGYRYGASKGLFTLGAHKLPSLHVRF